jgi:hypothetical protein
MVRRQVASGTTEERVESKRKDSLAEELNAVK